MSLGRSILAVVLGIALLASLTPVHAFMTPAKADDGHACCKKDATPEQQQAPKKCCDDGSCAMQCCRVIPATIEIVPGLVGCTSVVELTMVRPADLHSLTEPQAIFHPPRA